MSYDSGFRTLDLARDLIETNNLGDLRYKFRDSLIKADKPPSPHLRLYVQGSNFRLIFTCDTSINGDPEYLPVKVSLWIEYPHHLDFQPFLPTIRDHIKQKSPLLRFLPSTWSSQIVIYVSDDIDVLSSQFDEVYLLLLDYAANLTTFIDWLTTAKIQFHQQILDQLVTTL